MQVFRKYEYPAVTNFRPRLVFKIVFMGHGYKSYIDLYFHL